MPYEHSESRRHKFEKARYKMANWREYRGRERRSPSPHVTGHQGHVVQDQAHFIGRRKDHVHQRIVLPLHIIDPRHHPSDTPVEVALDHRSDVAERIEAPRRAPFRKIQILVKEFARRHIVDTGEAEDVIVRLFN